MTKKEGQIAHIDRDASNADEQNLAFLCLEHHNYYDTKQSQAKSVKPSELKHARDGLHLLYGNTDKSEYYLDLNLNGISEGVEDQFLALVRSLISDTEIEYVKTITPTCIRLSLRLRGEQAKQLVGEIDAGTFGAYKVKVTSLNPVTSLLEKFNFGGLFASDPLTEKVVPHSMAIDTIRNADSQQHFRNASPVRFKDSVCSVFVKRFGKSARNEYTSLVLTSNIKNPIEVWAGFRVYNTDVHHTLDWEPINILTAFLDKFGIDLQSSSLKPTRLVRNYFLPIPLSIWPGKPTDDFIKSEIQCTNYLENIGWIDRCISFEFTNVVRGARIELGLAVERRRYGLSLQKHGLKIPYTLIPDTRSARRRS